MESPKFLSAFNFPGGKVTQGRRDVTNVPAQALALLNDPFVLQQAERWAERVVSDRSESSSRRITVMFHAALCREPNAAEIEHFQQAVRDLGDLHQVPPGEVLQSRLVWKEIAHAIFNLQEFIFIP